MFCEAKAMNQTCFGVQSKEGTPFAIYCHARHFMDRIVHGAHGSVFDTITTRTFETTDVLLPPPEILKAFDSRIALLFEQVRANLHQNKTLANLRDRLLLWLLSGCIEGNLRSICHVS